MLKAHFLSLGVERMLEMRDRRFLARLPHSRTPYSHPSLSRDLTCLHFCSAEGGGRTLLHTACWWGVHSVVELLVALGHDVNWWECGRAGESMQREGACAGGGG